MQLKLTSLSSVAQSFILVAACVAAPSVALADGAVLAWGDNTLGQRTIPTAALSGVTTIAGGAYHTIAVTRDTASCQTDLNQLWVQYDAMRADRDLWISQYDAMRSDRDALISQNTALTSYIAAQTSQITELTSQITALTSQNTSLTSQNTSLINQNTSLTSQITALTSQTTLLNSQNTSLNSQNTSLNSQIAALASQIAVLTSENATLDSENTALTAQLTCGDLNGDGEVNGGDLGKLLISWGQCQ
jgi:regulator of replication initiation timing